MNILIVDDECRAIQAVKAGLRWDDLKFDRVFTARNKKEAVACLRDEDIGLVLCDIEMPMGSGLEILEWANKNREETGFVFMTCHADFSYAQKAIRLGSLDYVLKPLDFENLENVLKLARKRIMERRHLKDTNSYWQDSRKDYSRQFWKDLFTGDIAPKRDSVSQYWSQRHIDFPLDELFLPVLISVKCWKEDMRREDERLFFYAMRNVADDLFEIPGVYREVVPFSENMILVVLRLQRAADNELKKALKDACRRAIEVYSQHLSAEACCYIGTVCSIYKMPDSLETLQAADFNNVLLTRNVLAIEEAGTIYKEHGGGYFEIWSELLQHRQYGKIYEQIKEIVEDSKKNGNPGRALLTGLYRDFDYLLYRHSKKNHIFMDSLISGEKARRLLEAADATVEGFMVWAEYSLRLFKEFEEKNNSKSAVELTREYINSNLDRELGAAEIAGHIHLNPDYLNRIFKKEMGIAISQYVIQQKIQKAKWLLDNTKSSLGDIAAEVGYFNYSSFNRNFSKIAGMSPREYKLKGSG